MNGLPYFKWFPADAETDDDYTAMTDAELGFYHRCLNRSWINNGLPSEPGELARLMKVSAAYLKRIWVRVGRKFKVSESGRLVNPRQEMERSQAIRKSERSADAARKSHANGVRSQVVRRDSAVPRALTRPDSGFDSDSSEEIKKCWSELWKLDPYGTSEESARVKFLELMTVAVDPSHNSAALVESRRAWIEYCQASNIKALGTLKWLDSGDCWKQPPAIPQRRKSMMEGV